MHIYALITVLFCYTNLIACAPSDASALSDQHQRLTGRSPKYDFGLGKRRYILRTTETGSKRIPHYDFGLGKRSVSYQPFSFGLGKRADYYDEEPYGDGRTDELNDDEIQALKAVLEAKRSRQYTFGLGKRNGRYDFGLGKKRSNEEYDKRLPNRYNFGLGRR